MEKIELNTLKKMITSGTQFQVVEIHQFKKTLFNNTEKYYVSFFTKGGADYQVCTQIRKDRSSDVKQYSRIDIAVKQIKETGYKGAVLIMV